MDLSWFGIYLFELEIFVLTHPDIITRNACWLTYFSLQVSYCSQIPRQLVLQLLKHIEFYFVVDQPYLTSMHYHRTLTWHALL